MRFRLLIDDCDSRGFPIGAKCPNCGYFVGRNKLKTHQLKCGKKHIGVHHYGVKKI